ncbi:TPR-like protein [Clavulina sp. PMI_390]|nr:TPR-like protein [Clavulina sp. PMI_390]
MASPLPATHYVALRLRTLIWSCLDCDLISSALFFSERYFCIDPENHEARHLFATSLLKAGQVHSALHRVQDQNCSGCSRIYSDCCAQLGRFREAEEAMRRCMNKDGGTATLGTSPFARDPRQFPDLAVMACRAGIAAMKGNMTREAIAHFNRSLAINPFIWEAVEGLSRLGSFFNVDEVLPPRPSNFTNQAGPSNHSATTSSTNGTSLFTPESTTNGHGAFKIQGNPAPFRLNGILGPRDSIGSVADSSFGEYNSPGLRSRVFTSDMMLTNNRSTTATIADGRPAPKRARAEAATTRFADGEGVRPSVNTRSGNGITNGKRARDVSNSSPLSPFLSNTDLLQPAVPRAVPEHAKEPSRRSTRSSAQKTAVGAKTREIKRVPRGAAANAAAAAVARNTTSPASEDENMMSVDALHPMSPTEPPEPPNWSIAAKQNAESMAISDADGYIMEITRVFARAVQSMAKFDCDDVIETLDLLPIEQQYSPTVMTLLGKAFFEKLDYVKAERCFANAREYDPYSHIDMDIYSTLLWHLARPTHLSFLSQELLGMNNASPSAWIAAGNCFSLQKEHSQALVCFRRATQLDPRCTYAYNLSGHESIAIDEPDQAVDFFRQAIRIDSRHYPAWYGLGMVYYRSNKLDQAEWHFRRACQINPSNAVLVCCDALVQEQRKNWIDALEIYNRAVQLAPNSSLVLFKRARMLVECQHWEAARDVLLRLVDTIPDEVNVPFMLAQVYTKLDEPTLAAKYMAVAQEIEPKIASAVRAILQQRGMGAPLLDALAPNRNTQDQSMDEG